MAFSVICDGEFQHDVAQEYQVTAGFVSRLVKKVKSNSRFFEELINKKDEMIQERALVAQKISDLNA